MNKIIDYTIKDGDTLASISQITLGDATKFIEIAVLNKLDYPFIGRIGDERNDNIAYPGDIIKIPVSILDDTGLTSDTNYISNEDCDILLNGDDFNLTSYAGGEFETNTYGDLVTVQGDACLSQDLVNRLKTEEGTLLFHPTYGSKLLTLIGTKQDSVWLQRVSIEVLKTIRSDPRVVNVSNLVLTPISYGVHIECTVSTDSTQFVFNESLTKQQEV